MKAIMHLPKVTIEVEGDDIKDLWKQMSVVSESLGDRCCGVCGCEDVHPRVREVGEGKNVVQYYELVCQNAACRAKLEFGQHRDGSGIFPKRKLNDQGEVDMENGRWTKTRGWHVWKGNKEKK